MATKVTKAMKKYEQTKKKSKPGSGARFKALSNALEAKGVENPDALAAYIGRKKYGQKKFQAMAKTGRKK